MSEAPATYGTRRLRIADDLTLPKDAVTQTFGVLAVRGSGKSNLAAVMAEQMSANALPFVVIDPVGSWWGLRSNAAGIGPGLSIPIFGGRHGDIPLERTAGNEVADLVVDERASCVLDLAEFSEGDKIRFLIDFAERLYRRNEMPLHLFLEEADDYIPQRPMREQARLLRAWENIVRRGRARGLGMTMITQRSAAINKNVLTQIETLFVLRTTSPNDRKAIEGWVDYHGERRDVLATLPSLGNGEAWVWSPNWLHQFKRVKIHRRTTFDSAATPKQSAAGRKPATLADIDLSAVQKRFAATIERAKADDPKALRAEVARLQRELAAAQKATPAPAEPVKGPVLEGEELKRLEGLLKRLDAATADHDRARQKLEDQAQQILALIQKHPTPSLRDEIDTLRATIAKAMAPASVAPRADNLAPAARQAHASPAPAPRQRQANDAATAMQGGKFRAMLVTLAQAGRPLADGQVAARAGMALSGTFDKYLSAQRANGWVDGPRSALQITREGLAALGQWDPLPTGPALRNYWLDYVGGGKKREMLATLIDAWPQSLSDQVVADRAAMALSGTFDKYLSELRKLLLVEGPRTALRASEELYT